MSRRDEVSRKMLEGYPDGTYGFEYTDEYDYEVHNKKFEVPAYDGSLRLVHLGPQEIRRRLQTEKDPEVIKAMTAAMDYYRAKPGLTGFKMDSSHEAGEPYRGQAPTAKRISDLREVISKERVQYLYGSSLGGAPVGSGEGVIDMNVLMNGGDTDGHGEAD